MSGVTVMLQCTTREVQCSQYFKSVFLEIQNKAIRPVLSKKIFKCKNLVLKFIFSKSCKNFVRHTYYANKYTNAQILVINQFIIFQVAAGSVSDTTFSGTLELLLPSMTFECSFNYTKGHGAKFNVEPQTGKFIAQYEEPSIEGSMASLEIYINKAP